MTKLLGVLLLLLGIASFYGVFYILEACESWYCFPSSIILILLAPISFVGGIYFIKLEDE